MHTAAESSCAAAWHRQLKGCLCRERTLKGWLVGARALQLVLFHGCYHDASGNWPYDPVHCPECLGLPEEVAHVKQVGWWLTHAGLQRSRASR